MLLAFAVYSFIQTTEHREPLPATGGGPSALVLTPPAEEPFGFTSLTFIPTPPAKTDSVKIFACTQGQGGVGTTIRVWVNSAPDGSGDGKWIEIKELGVPCFTWEDAPVWNTKGWKPGTYLVRAEAKTADDPSWKNPVAIESTYTLR